MDEADNLKGHSAWGTHQAPLADLLDHAVHRDALVRLVRSAPPSAPPAAAVSEALVRAMVRARIEPMVRGLFTAVERPAVAELLERSVVLVTPASVERLICSEPWLSTAESVAHLYLASVGAADAAPKTANVIALTVGVRCYVTAASFADLPPLADPVVHEAAHVLHNARRTAAGLAPTGRKERLAEIEFARRELFAYTCEAFACLQRLGATRRQRLEVLEAQARSALPAGCGVDAGKYIELLARAVASRNGWKTILRACAPVAAARAVRSDERAGAAWPARVVAEGPPSRDEYSALLPTG